MPTTHKNNLIDEKACNIFKNMLSDFADFNSLSHFKIREDKPDVHIDYFIEYFDKGEPSGLRTGIQLKGSEGFRESATYLKKKFFVKHLLYYLDKVNQPVFLIVVDVKTRKAYWVHSQEYLKDLDGKLWRTKKTLTINIPKSNTLDDFEKFKNSVEDAHILMREFYPSSIKSSIDNKIKKIKELDPRFNIEFQHSNGLNKFILTPNQDFSLGVKVTGKAINKFKTFLNSGLKTEFEPGEMKIIGSNIFDQKSSHSISYVLESAKQGISNINFFTIKENTKLSLVLGLPTKMYTGKKQITFEYNIDTSPLLINLNVNSIKKFGLSFIFDFNRWKSQAVSDLVDFIRIEKIINSIDNNEQLSVIIDMNGQAIESSSILKEKYNLNYKLSTFINLVKKIQYINLTFKLSLRFPDISFFTEENVAEINKWYHLITQGKYSTKNEAHSFKFKAPKNLTNTNTFNEGQSASLTVKEPCFMGKAIADKILTVSYSEMKLIELNSSKPSNYYNIEMKSSDNTLIEYVLSDK